MESVQNKVRIFVHAVKLPDRERYDLYIDGPGGILPAGARLLRGAPWDGKFWHDNPETAEADAASLEKYIEKHWTPPAAKRKARR